MFGTDLPPHAPRQLYHLGIAPGADCRLLPPAADLGTAVHYHWTLDIDAGLVELPVIPDNAADLVLCPGLADFAALYLPVEKAFAIALEGPVRYVGSCLRIERLHEVLGHSPATLRQLAPGAATVATLGLEPLIGRLPERDGPAVIARHLDDFLRERLAGERRAEVDPEHIAPSVFERFVDTLEPERVADMARRIGISERQFRRETRRLFGLAPKTIQRIVRLQRAIAELVDGAPPLADYHDDSHRIRELRALTGWTPGEIRRLAETYNTRRR